MQAPALVFGAAGQVGQALMRTAGDRLATGLGRADLDISNDAAVAAVLDERQPAAVINAAVFQSVDRCEGEVAAAFAVNALASGALAAACRRRGVRMLQLSTDYVFDGERADPYEEDACPGPLCVYAASKAAGEHLVLAAGPEHCIVRTSSVYGKPAGGGGTAPFVARMFERARAGEPTRVVDDQVVSPTHADDLATAIWRLIDAEAAGIIHAAGSTPASWYELAEYVFKSVGRADLLSRTTAEEYGAPARRPAYSALASKRLEELGIAALPGWREGVERYLAALS